MKQNLRILMDNKKLTLAELLLLSVSFFIYFFFFNIIKALASNPIPTIHEITALVTNPNPCVNPATTKVRQETMATVNAYGNWDETWCTCLHSAPALAIMVVSEIGDI